jgi:HlyD family secretion protein
MVLMLVAAGGALGYGLYARGKAPKQRWQTAKVQKTDITAQVTATGALQPVVTSPVGAQVSGIVWKLHADFNSQVQKDQILVELDPALFKNAVEQAVANLATAEASEAKAKAALVDAKRISDRNAELAKQHYVAQSDADTAQANWEGAVAALKGAEANVIQARVALGRSKLDLEHSVIRSPVNGTVISRNVDVGQAVAASFTAPTLFTIAQDLTKMQVHANIDEADIGQVRVGEAATFTVDAFRGERFKATVSQVRNAAQTVQNVVTYDVVMNVDNPELKLRPGMTANVRIVAATREGVLAVPNAALRFKPPVDAQDKSAAVTPRRTHDDKPMVYVPDGEAARRVPVETGITDGTITEVRKLDEGSEVIVDVFKDKDKAAGLPGGAQPPRAFGRGF